MKMNKVKEDSYPCKCKVLSFGLLSIFVKYKGKRNFIVPLLADIKDKFGVITEKDVSCIVEHLNISENEIEEAVKTHDEFEIVPVKQHLIKVCGGAACQKCGSKKLLETASEELQIVSGNTTDDDKFKLEVVGCVGLCDIAPVIGIDNTFYGRIDESDVKSLLAHEKQISVDD